MTSLEHQVLHLELPVTLRLATAEDLPKLEWHGQYIHFRNMFRRTFREQQIGRRLMLLADFNNFPIGHIFIQLRSSNRRRPRAYFYSFRVMEMFRRQGVGTWLLANAEALVYDQGLRRAAIAAAKDNHDARRLYERLGYQVYGDDAGRWSYIDHRGQTCHVSEPCWLLEKILNLR